jgi:hypothetical protein
MANYLSNHKKCRLIVVDTFAKVRQVAGVSQQMYMNDYLAAEPLKKLADAHEISVLVVHHLIKSSSSKDLLDEVSGSTGLTANADSILILGGHRGRKDAELTVIARDIEDDEIPLVFDSESCVWRLAENVNALPCSTPRQEIIQVLLDCEGKPVGVRHVKHELEKDGRERNENTIGNLMRNMDRQGQIIRVGYGKYIHSDHSDHGDQE